MFKLDVFIQMWAIMGCGILAFTWLFITIGCAIGEYTKRFRLIWGIFTGILIIIGSIITACL